MLVFLALKPIVVVFSQPGSGLYPPRFRGFLITHNDAPQSVGLLWMSDQFVAETSDNTQHSQQTNIHASGGIRTHNLSRRVAEDLRLARGHWDRLLYVRYVISIYTYKFKTISLYVFGMVNMLKAKNMNRKHKLTIYKTLTLRLPNLFFNFSTSCI